MQKWEYQTLLVKQGGGKIVEVIQVNGKEAKAVEPGGFLRSPVYGDLTTYLVEAGREGWEVAGLSPVTSSVPAGGAGEGRVTILILLKRPVSG